MSEPDNNGAGDGNALFVRGVTKRFGPDTILSNVTLTVEEGTVTSLVGPNGAGKSTLFNIIAGLVRPDHGSVFLRKENVTFHPSHEIARRGVAYLMQEHLVLSGMSVRDNVMIGVISSHGESLTSLFFNWRKSSDQERRQRLRLADVLNKYELQAKENTSAEDLSLGEKRRLAFARIMFASADVLLLDEPTAGLDSTFMYEIAARILAFKAEGKTVFVVSHDLDFVRRVSDNVYLMDQGQIIANGTPKEILIPTNFMKHYGE